MEAGLVLGSLATLTAMACFFVTKRVRIRYPAITRSVAFLLATLLAGGAGFFAGVVFGEANAVVENASTAAEEAEAGPLVFVAVMLFGVLASCAAAVGGGIGALVAFRSPGKP